MTALVDEARQRVSHHLLSASANLGRLYVAALLDRSADGGGVLGAARLEYQAARQSPGCAGQGPRGCAARRAGSPRPSRSSEQRRQASRKIRDPHPQHEPAAGLRLVAARDLGQQPGADVAAREHEHCGAIDRARELARRAARRHPRRRRPRRRASSAPSGTPSPRPPGPRRPRRAPYPSVDQLQRDLPGRLTAMPSAIVRTNRLPPARRPRARR